MKKILLINIFLTQSIFLFSQYNLQTCTTDIADDVPQFFREYFSCVTIKMSENDNYTNIYFNNLPPHESWYYPEGNDNYIEYYSLGDSYKKNPGQIKEFDYVISVPNNPVEIDGAEKGENAADYTSGTDANEYPMSSVGVALNGVSLFNPFTGPQETIEEEFYSFDVYGGHPAPTGDYHYHTASLGPLEVLKHKELITNTNPGSAEIEIYGVMCDGVVVMGCNELNTETANLSSTDAQNGHKHDIINEKGEVLFENRYHTHICYDSITDEDTNRNGYNDYEFVPESSYYQSEGVGNSNICKASSSPVEPDKEYSNLSSSLQLSPTIFGIKDVYPNPFNASTSINYELNEYTKIKLIITNAIGELITELVNDFKSSGLHIVNWDASDYPSGIYFVSIHTQNFVNTQKLILLK